MSLIVVACSATVLVTARPSDAEPTATVTVGYETQIAVDDVNGHVFVSSGRPGAGIAVFTLDGTRLPDLVVDGTPGPITVRRDRLYVGYAEGEIREYDTATLALLRSFTVPLYVSSVVAVGGAVYFAHGHCSWFQPTDGVGAIDLASGAITYVPHPFYCSRIVPIPHHLGWVMVYSRTHGEVYRVDMATARVAKRSSYGGMDLAVSPDGSTYWTVGAGAAEYRVDDLSFVRSTAAWWATAVAMRSDGSIVVGLDSAHSPDVGPDIKLLSPDDLHPTFGWNAADHGVYHGALEVNAAGDRIYALTGYDPNAGLTLHVITVSDSTEPPTVDAVAPATGDGSKPVPVRLTGTGFLGADAVRFGTADAVSFDVVSDTEMTVVAPPIGKATTVEIAVRGRSGWSITRTWFEYSLPFPSSFPTPGAGAYRWATRQGDRARTGVVDQSMVSPANFTGLVKRWEVKASVPAAGAPIVVDGTVFYITIDSTLWAIDARTGAERWHVGLGPQIGLGNSTSPTIADGTLFVALNDQLQARDPRTGDLRWTTSVVGARGDLAATTTRVFVPTDSGVTAVDLETHSIAWVGRVGPLYWTAVAGGAVVVATSSHVIALSARNGRTRWVTNEWVPYVGAPTIAGSTMYYTTQGYSYSNPQLVAGDLATGRRLWTASVPLAAAGAGPVVGGATVFVGTNGYDTSTGAALENNTDTNRYARGFGVYTNGLLVSACTVADATDARRSVSLPNCAESGGRAVVDGAIYLTNTTNFGPTLTAIGLPA